jgi:hypothetical protein
METVAWSEWLSIKNKVMAITEGEVEILQCFSPMQTSPVIV